ncbi:MAG: hypothetical protein ABFD08_04795 [Syntrophomonas sp.]
MNIVLRLLQWHFPPFIKKKQLNRLFTITAGAFGCEAPPIRTLTFEQCLHEYALFTKELTEGHLKSSSDIDLLKERLFQGAYYLGQDLRRQFGIATSQEVMLVMKIIYNLLGIDLQSEAENQVLIKRCFFSHYYSPEICQVISALDEGLAAGLSDGGKLGFYQRITEGNNCCRAKFILKEV